MLFSISGVGNTLSHWHWSLLLYLNHSDENKNAITQHCEQIKRKRASRGEDISRVPLSTICAPPSCFLPSLVRGGATRSVDTKKAPHGTQNWQVAPNACRFASSAKLFSPAGFSATACAVKCIFKDGRRVSPLSNRRLACRRKNRPAAVDDKSLVSFTLLKWVTYLA